MFQDPPIWKSGFGRHPVAKDANNTTEKLPPPRHKTPNRPKTVSFKHYYKVQYLQIVDIIVHLRKTFPFNKSIHV